MNEGWLRAVSCNKSGLNARPVEFFFVRFDFLARFGFRDWSMTTMMYYYLQ
jgi:hypothetical protein